MINLGPLVRVKAVQPLDNFSVRLVFSDATEKTVDLGRFLRGPIFESIRNDMTLFRAVKVIGSTIGWENGANIDPDVLYYDLQPAWEHEIQTGP